MLSTSLDRSTFLDKTNDYFSADFMLTDTTFLAGTTEKDGVPTNWKLFRVPLSSFKKVQNIEWNEIRYVRLAITGLDSVQKQIQIAKMEIVGNEWQEVGIMDQDSSLISQSFVGNRSNSIENDGPQFKVAVINTEDNADFNSFTCLITLFKIVLALSGDCPPLATSPNKL